MPATTAPNSAGSVTMKLFTNAERYALLEAVETVPAKPVVPGWRGYTLVTFTRAPADLMWRVESSERLAKPSADAARARTAATKAARRLGIAVRPDTDRYALNYSPNADWWAVQAWVENTHGNEVVLACMFPDVVWAQHFPDVRGRLVAVVQWPPGANNNHELCRVAAVCLGADAWPHLDAAAAAFRTRMCTSPDIVESPFRICVTTSGTPRCEHGALMSIELPSYVHGDETWSAEVVADLSTDDPLHALISASKQ